MRTLNYESGQSLFELVVAVAISAMVIVVLVSLATVSIRNSSFSNNKARAATYTQEAAEWLRGQRDSDISTFITSVGLATDPNKRCLNVFPTTVAFLTIAPCGSGTTIAGTPFQRYVVFSINTYSVNGQNKEVMTADITVFWSDAQGLHEVTNATNFSDWRQR
jgi:hypothetical protein